MEAQMQTTKLTRAVGAAGAFLILALAGAPALADFNTDWKELIAAARKEGKVVLNAVPGARMRKELPVAFKNKFGVELEFVAVRTRQAAQRAIREAATGVLSSDMIGGGQSTLARVLYAKGMLAPIKPLLIHPDAKNPAVWKKGKPWFIDDQDAYLLRIVDLVVPVAALNANIVKPSDFKSGKDLLDPKWKGKIAAFDPTRPGPGSNTVSHLMRLHGDKFALDLFKGQKVRRTRNRRQLADWLAQGRYPIAIALSITEAARLRSDGFNIGFVMPDDTLPAGGPASGVLVLLKGAPHPKAAQLFLNWIITKEGMQLYSDLEGAPTTRSDLNTSKLLIQESVPKPGVKYFDTAEWNYVMKGARKQFKKIKQMLGGGKSRKRKKR
jgi:ABC-type Fe3+ transport system substrate-binding protein